jgi:uncharacterized protein YbjT (DUF2867 family)
MDNPGGQKDARILLPASIVSPDEARRGHMNDKKKILVTGARGRVGRQVVEKVIAAGHEVRALGRDAAALRPLAELGAAPFAGDMRDPACMKEAFAGIDAAFLVAQGDRTTRDYRADFARAGASYAEAAHATKLRTAVFVSTTGAHDEQNRGLVGIHGDVERILDRVPDLSLVHLRAPGLYENLLYFLPVMKATGVLSWPITQDAVVDMISTRDLADIAVRYLTRSDLSGRHVVEIHGPEPITIRHIAGLLSGALGRSFPARPEQREDEIHRLVTAGFGRDFAMLMNDTWEMFSRDQIRSEPAVAESVRVASRVSHYVEAELAPMLR